MDRLVDWFVRVRRAYWRRKRLLFISPAEARFIEIMGGIVVRFPLIKDPRTGFPLAKVVRYGWVMRTENVRREVPVGPFCLDFGNDLKRGIEIDSSYHTDVVADFDREVYLNERGWRLLRIKASDLYRDRKSVQLAATKFLAQ
jgi:hypothetical protein